MASNKPIIIGGAFLEEKPDGQDLNAGSGKVTNVLTPTASSDAATKGYVDAQALANWDGGTASTNYGGTTAINGGTA